VLPVLRRVAPLLLVAAAVLLGAVLVWPTQHLVSRTGGVTERLVDVWFGGRVRGVSDTISANGDSSPGLVALVAGTTVVLLAAAVVWMSTRARGSAPPRRRRVARPPAVSPTLLSSVATSVLAVAFAVEGSASFGWTSTRELGQLEFERTPVALFLPAAAALAALAVIVMLVATFRRRPPV
jgi:hypothetical protein